MAKKKNGLDRILHPYLPCISVISSMFFFSSSENPRKLKMQSWNGGTLNSFLNSSAAAQKSLKEGKDREKGMNLRQLY